MSIREKLNENPAVAIGVVGLLIVLCVGYLVWSNSGGPQDGVGTGQAYYSVDDGATFFLDDSDRIAPFEKDGQQAYKAYVFEPRGGGEPFVGYLEGLPAEAADAQRKQRESGAASAGGPPTQTFGALVKRPGEGNWVPKLSAEGAQITRVDGVPVRAR